MVTICTTVHYTYDQTNAEVVHRRHYGMLDEAGGEQHSIKQAAPKRLKLGEDE